MNKKESKSKKRSKKKSSLKNIVYILIGVAIFLIIILCLLFENSVNTSGWVRNGDKITDGTTTYTIGDYYEYDETNGGKESVIDVKWKVMNVDEDGHLLIVSDVPVEEFTLGSESDVEKAKNDYLNGTKEMNNLCEKYGDGENAKDARCISNADIIKTFNLKEEDVPLIKRDILYLWGLENSLVAVDENHEKFISPTHGNGIFIWFDKENNSWEKSIAPNNSTNDDLSRIISLKSELLALTGFAFDPNFAGNFDEESVYLGTDPKMKMFFSESLANPVTYWTIDTFDLAETSSVGYGFNVVKGFDISYDFIVYSNEQIKQASYPVRPVVVIK